MAQLAPVRTRGVCFFPQEIIDATIDFLDRDNASLRAVGLVKRSWYHRTREHLFREITFRGNNIVPRCIKFKQLIEDRPTLARCVEQLALGSSPVSADLAHVIAITPLLTSLAGVTLNHLYWEQMSEELATSLRKLMSNPRVHKIALRSVYNIDITPLSQLHNLKELVLSGVILSSKPSIVSPAPRTSSPVPPTSRGRLRILHIHCCSPDILKTLVAAESADGILDILPTTLIMGARDFDFDMKGPGPVLERCGAFVENYHIVDNLERFPPQAFALRCFPKLKSFTTTFPYYFFRHDNPLPILLHEFGYLSQSVTPRDLSKIRLEFNFPRTSDEDPEAIAAFDFWARLDGFLVKPAFSRLKSLIISFDTTYGDFSTTAWERVRTKILSSMSNLSTCPGIVQVMKHRR